MEFPPSGGIDFLRKLKNHNIKAVKTIRWKSDSPPLERNRLLGILKIRPTGSLKCPACRLEGREERQKEMKNEGNGTRGYGREFSRRVFEH